MWTKIFISLIQWWIPCIYKWHVCVLVPSRFSHIWLFVILWTVAHQAPLFRGLSRQEYWSGLPCTLFKGTFPTQGWNPRLLCLLHWQAGSSPRVSPGKSINDILILHPNICTPLSFLGSTSGKEPAGQCRTHKRHEFDPWVGKIPWRRAWQPTSVFLPGESPWTEESGGLQSMESQKDMTEAT